MLNLEKCLSQSLLCIREIWRIISSCLVSSLLHLHFGRPTLLHSLLRGFYFLEMSVSLSDAFPLSSLSSAALPHLFFPLTWMHAKSLQSCLCLILCNPKDCSPPGSPGGRIMGFSRQEYWSGLLGPPQEDLHNPEMEPVSPKLPCIGRWVLYHQWHLGGPPLTWAQYIPICGFSQLYGSIPCYSSASYVTWNFTKRIRY